MSEKRWMFKGTKSTWQYFSSDGSLQPFFFSEQPIGSYFLSHSQEKSVVRLKVFFLRVCLHFQQLHFPHFARQLGYFWVNTCETAGKSKDMCKCVYLKRVFIQIYFWILFTGSEELWLFLIHTHASHPKLFKKKNENMGPEFSCCHFPLLCNQNFHVIFHTSHLPPSRCCCNIRHQSVTSFTELL